jgi:hypothetical protein
LKGFFVNRLGKRGGFGKWRARFLEPEDFLKLAERMNSWALMVALIGEGQEI